MTLKKGSTRDAINNIYQVLISDEELLRLLYYKPKSARNPDPLSDELPNILDKDISELWDFRDERIVQAEKTSDLVDKEICRMYVSMGRRRGRFDNDRLVNQEVIIGVFTHESYDDLRQEWIMDRINELIALERFNSTYGRLEYVAGDPRVAPRFYSSFIHVYRFVDGKK